MFRKRCFSDIELDDTNNAFKVLSIHNDLNTQQTTLLPKKNSYIYETLSTFENQRKRKKVKDLNLSFEDSLSMMQIDADSTKLMTSEVAFDDIEVDVDSGDFKIDKQFLDLSSIHYEKLNYRFFNNFIREI